MQGAKRRKPQKISRITPQHQQDDEVTDEDRCTSPPTLAIVTPSPPAAQFHQEDQQQQPTLVQEPIIPPGPIPTPIISSTTVVTCSPDNVFNCPLCKDELKSQKDFTTHIRAHNEVKPHPDPSDPTGQAKVYYCCLCGKMLSSFSSLDRHMLVHSGERPFSCELCGQTFTTNGNMHRHKRTHSAKELQEYGEATGISLIPSKRGGRKKKVKETPTINGDQHKNINNNTPKQEAPSNNGSSFSCPVCKIVFPFEQDLESHVMSLHPGDEFKCDLCPASFASYSVYKFHKEFHSNALATSVNLPCPSLSVTTASVATPPIFGKPLSAFLSAANGVNSSPRPKSPPEVVEICMTPPPSDPTNIPSTPKSALVVQLEDNEEEKDQNDLADVQSILNITKACSPSNGITQEKEHLLEEGDERSLTPGAHDDNDPVIKDMKLKGEFPCRLCPAVYPNLRALKGHNKEHLDKPPYVCNVGTCTYYSNDKSTLTRHMRTHTGEKPYECRLCNYGFTTKANCERHLKNKHGRTTRDDIRSNLIIHETEETIAAGEVIPGAGRALPVTPSIKTKVDPTNASPFRCKVCKQLFPTSARVIAHAIKDHPAYSSDVDHIFEEVKPKLSTMSRIQQQMAADVNSAPSMVPRTSNFPPLSQQQLQKQSQILNGKEEDTPLDLSRPTDEKKQDHVEILNSTQSHHPPTLPPPPPLTLDPALRGEILKHHPTLAMSLVPQLVIPTPAVVPGQVAANPSAPRGMALQVPLVPAAAAAAAALNLFPMADNLTLEMRQRLHIHFQQQQQQAAAAALLAVTGGSIPPVQTVQPRDMTSLLNAVAQQDLVLKQKTQQPESTATMHNTHPNPINEGKENVNESDTFPLEASQNKEEQAVENGSDSDSNYKMIIQNGILMKKQKQRRYRTERPYSCDHCSARFTLRSNMERHIKQQHPEHWSSKPRGSRRNHAATVPVIAPQFRENKECLKEDLEQTADLVSVSKLIESTVQQPCKHLLEPHHDGEDAGDLPPEESVFSSDENGENNLDRKKSAYSAAPHKIACPFCSRKFPWTSSLKRHILTHTGDKPYTCLFCPLTFTTKSNCDRHQLRKHGSSTQCTNSLERDSLVCPLCPASTFATEKSLEQHKYSVHLNMEYPDNASSNEDEDDEEMVRHMNGSSTPRVAFPCPLCDQSFPERSEAIGHLELSHASDYDKLVAKGAFGEAKRSTTTSNDGEDGDEEDCTPTPMHGTLETCLFCQQSFGSIENLRRHLRKHTGERPYTCDICHKRFTLRHSMLRHRKKHDSGVSSEEMTEDCDTDEALVTHVQSKPGDLKRKLSEAKQSLPVKKKKASLMDTIAKLSNLVKK